MSHTVIHVYPHHVDPTPFAEQMTRVQYANACPSSSELHPTVVSSASSIPTAPQRRRASTTSVAIPAPAHVVPTPSAVSSDIPSPVHVHQAMRATPLCSVSSSRRNNRNHVNHRHVERMLSVLSEMELLPASASMSTRVIPMRAVAQSACSVRIVPQIRLASGTSARILVQASVVPMRNATRSTMCPTASAMMATLEIHSRIADALNQQLLDLLPIHACPRHVVRTVNVACPMAWLSAPAWRTSLELHLTANRSAQ